VMASVHRPKGEAVGAEQARPPSKYATAIPVKRCMRNTTSRKTRSEDIFLHFRFCVTFRFRWDDIVRVKTSKP